MYYRRKILISVIKAFGGKLSKIDLQKLLFLFSQQQKKPSFHFVPYKFGCYSFQANADLKTLEKYGLTSSDSKNWYVSNREAEIELLKEDKEILKNINYYYKSKLGDELVKHTYLHYPYYAIYSQIKEKLLDKRSIEKIIESKPQNNETALYTIGYEGISLEEYLNKLIKYDIKVLCDVRNNAMSMKFGFSKSQLKNACESIGIQYLHFPELGIRSEFRKTLVTQSDYDILFVKYNHTTIPETLKTQERLIELLKEYNRIAITCFEANICQCHRLHLSNSLKNLPNFNYKVNHI